MKRLHLLLAGLPLLAPNLGHAQAVYGSIYGTVTDNTGAVVPNVDVIVTDVAKGTTQTIKANGSGDFSADHLIPDEYTVKISSNGFKDVSADRHSRICGHVG